MIFYHKEFLYLLFLVPFLIFFFVKMTKKKYLLMDKFINRGLWDQIIPDLYIRRQKQKILLLVLSIIFLILSLSGPQYGAKTVDVKQEGLDIFIAVDCSKSMLAQDFKPNRMMKAKRSMAMLIDKLSGNRIGLIAFAGEALLACPLTIDQSAVTMYLDEFNTNYVPMPGTAIGKAIQEAMLNFPKDEEGTKIIVLLTDGEDNENTAISAANEAKAKGVVIYCVGIGDPTGVPIPEKDEQDKTTGYKKDKSGKDVLTKLDENTLKEVSKITGGKYFKASYNDDEVMEIINEIKSQDKKKLKDTLFNRYEHRYQYPLALVLLFLCLEYLLTDTKKRKSE